MPLLHQHWVCFTCRKQFRKPQPVKSTSTWSEPYQRLQWKQVPQAVKYPCPECHAEMINMGKYFKPPRRENKQEWDKMQRLAEHGIRFYSDRTVAFLHLLGGSRPGKKAIEQMIACCRCHTDTEGKRLLRQIDRKPTKHK